MELKHRHYNEKYCPTITTNSLFYDYYVIVYIILLLVYKGWITTGRPNMPNSKKKNPWMWAVMGNDPTVCCRQRPKGNQEFIPVSPAGRGAKTGGKTRSWIKLAARYRTWNSSGHPRRRSPSGTFGKFLPSLAGTASGPTRR